MLRPLPLLFALSFATATVSSGAGAQPAPPDASATPAAGVRGGAEAPEDRETATALERARSFYQVGSYDQCADAYTALLLPPPGKPTPRLRAGSLEQARMHFAACLLALGRKQDADQQLRAAMRQNPLMASPDPVVFPAQVRDLFFQVKSDFLEEVRKAQEQQVIAAQRLEAEKAERARLERLRIQTLERMAAQEVVVHQNQRWVAALPFGVGQFQNGDNVLGALFLTAEAALLGATIAAVSRQLAYHSNADGGQAVERPEFFNDPLGTLHRVELWSGAGFFLLSGLGILEAQLNFVPEVYIGTRPRLNAPPATPSIRPVQGGAVLGWSTTF